MLTLASLVLLSISVLNTNRMIVDSDQEMYEGESLDLAVNFAEALLAEISSKKFDVNANETGTQDAAEFTPPSSLGPSSTEVVNVHPLPDAAWYKSIQYYNDVDDYVGYERTVNTARIRGYKVNANVYYVTDADPNNPATEQTYFKKVIVSVEHPSYLKRISFSTIVTY